MAPKANYDIAQMTSSSGEVRRLSLAEFEALPLLERVRAVLKGEVKFFLQGKEVSATQAVKH